MIILQLQVELKAEKMKIYKPQDFQSDIFKAIEEGKYTSVVYSLAHDVNVSVKDNKHNTPLHKAAQTGNLAIVTYLTEQKADIEALNKLIRLLCFN